MFAAEVISTKVLEFKFYDHLGKRTKLSSNINVTS